MNFVRIVDPPMRVGTYGDDEQARFEEAIGRSFQPPDFVEPWETRRSVDSLSSGDGSDGQTRPLLLERFILVP